MPRIRAQKIPTPKISPDDLLYTFCYFYPQYTYKEARELPYFRVVQMVNIARKVKAEEYYHLTSIVSASYTKNGEGVKKLLNLYKEIMDQD